ncbi:ribosome small subunit-dependent GTPase A [soil metagenome]
MHIHLLLRVIAYNELVGQHSMQNEPFSNLSPHAVRGVVVRAHGKFFAVQEYWSDKIHLATPRGTLKRYRQKSDVVVVGDRVWITPLDDDEARIEFVEPRTSILQRPARGVPGGQQIILSNADQSLFLFSVAQPEPHLRMLDRFLILAESTGMPAIIGVNKIDLSSVDPADPGREARRVFCDYEQSYPVFYLSAKQGFGIEPLSRALHGKLTVIAGPSGVGKSSLLNAIDPAALRQTRAISGATQKGRHTTTSAEIIRVGPETYLADTPGIRALAMAGVRPEELDKYFPEFEAYRGECFYADCRHATEPGCPVREAVEIGSISRRRYESYLALRLGDAD